MPFPCRFLVARLSFAACLGLLLAAGAAAGQGPADVKPGDAMIEKYLAQETARLSERPLDGATTREQWETRRPRLKQEYLDMLGLWPLPEKTPLHAKITGTIQRDDVAVEKLHFQSKPGLYVTGNLYRPAATGGLAPPKRPAVLYVCGHSPKGRNGNKAAFQDHGLWFASNGYVCLVIDTLQLGEIPGIHHGTYREGRWWWQAVGYTPAAVECWNGVRAIDYLLTRPDVDPDRLAVTGISGGGAATFWIAAADERVKCAVPVSGMSDLESYVTNKVINGHCDCMFLINTYQWEWTTIAALVAPRPMLFANSDNDRIFPMDGNRRIMDRLRKLYQMYGKPELVDEHVSRGGHDYRPDLRVAVFQWINKHVKNDAGPVKDADFKLFPDEELRVFPKDEDLPKDAINGKIDETFVPRARVKLPEAGKFDGWKKGLMKELRAHSFRPFPERIPMSAISIRGGGKNALFARVTEPSIDLRIESLVQLPRAAAEEAHTLIVLNRDEQAEAVRDWFKPLADAHGASTLAPRGAGPTAWARNAPPNYAERAQALIGRTSDQGRVWDIAANARFLAENSEGKKRLRVVGRGEAGVLAAYAALFEPSITEVVIVDPPTSHRDGPIFLNVLRVLDIPEALGMLAPRPLTLVNAKDPVFERTAQVYQAAGAADKLQRK